MIRVEHLSKSFGLKLAVNDVSFAVEPGEVLGFLGPNGAGKSTTMRMVAGYLPPDRGRISVCGFDVVRRPLEVKRRLGYLPEGAPTYGEMTPSSILGFVADVRRFSSADRRRRIGAMVERLHLETVLHQPIDTLSKGYKRRVGLALALLHEPEVLILDEPTDGLDPNQKHEVRELISAMSKDKIIVISTHILEEVDAVCTRAIIIAGGRLLADDTPRGLEARSRWHGAVTLALVEPVALESVRARLLRLPEVAAAEATGPLSITAFARAGSVALPGVAALAAREGWRLQELRPETGRLDEVFRSITTSRTAGAADA